MPVMKQFRIGSATYDTVGEASVTQVQTSGTKIATVTIDGTATDLYAPEGGGGSTVTVTQTLTSGTDIASISVDGTSTTLYAPTPPTVDNTPTQSSSNPVSSGGVYDLIHYYDNGNYGITTVGISGSDYVQFAGEPRYNNSALATTAQVSAKQDALVSGTNIKTINDESLLGSGNITIGGGGGGAGLVINAVVDSSGNVVSHDADTTTCLDFAQAAVNNSDASAVAYVRQYYYDDEDDYYSSSVYPLPLINASTNSYGGGQYDVSAGIRLVFGYARATIAGSAKMYIHTRELEISTMNDDPEMPVSITYTDKQASSNS